MIRGAPPGRVEVASAPMLKPFSDFPSDVVLVASAPMLKPFPDFPSDEVIAALVDEVATHQTLFGRATGSGEPELLRPEHAVMKPYIIEALVAAYLSGDGIYMPGAKPGVPEAWRTLRRHELHRATPDAGLHYEFTEYLPDLKGLEVDDDASQYLGVAEPTFQRLIKKLTDSLGKPKRKQKQSVEFEWGGSGARPVAGDPTWGGLLVKFGSQKKIALGGGDSAPWGVAYFIIDVMGVPRARP